MRFSENRADAFARYTLTGLLNEGVKKNGSKFILWMPRSELAKVLGLTKSRQEHVQYVADCAAKEGIVTGYHTSWVYFFYDEAAKDYYDQVDVDDAVSVTDAFAKVYGSQAIDELWEEWDEKGVRPHQTTGEAKRRGRPSTRTAPEE